MNICLYRCFRASRCVLRKDLLPPLPENQGFYENSVLYSVNENILNNLNTEWYSLKHINWNKIPLKKKIEFKEIIKNAIIDQFGNRTTIGIKDPRMAILLPIYHECLSELEYDIKFLNINRDCMAVAKSLKREIDLA